MRPAFTYRAFGLTIGSWIQCPELLPGQGSPEVAFRYGTVPATLEAPTYRNQWYEASPGRFLLLIPGVARYLIQHGEEIVIHPASEASASEIRLFLLGSAMGILLHQRGLLPLHASAIELPGSGAALFAGHAGVGKSTLAATWRARGFPVLSDDVSVITLDRGGRPLVLPGYPEIKLPPDAIEKTGTSLAGLPRARTMAEKYSLCFHREFAGAPLPARLVYILEPRAVPDFRILQLQGRAKLAALIEHTYRIELLEPVGARNSHFQICACLADHVQVKKVIRPRDIFLVAELADVLGQDVSRETNGSGALLEQGAITMERDDGLR